jgi:hypothetical protein
MLTGDMPVDSKWSYGAKVLRCLQSEVLLPTTLGAFCLLSNHHLHLRRETKPLLQVLLVLQITACSLLQR